MKFKISIISMVFCASALGATLDNSNATKELCGSAVDAFSSGNPRNSYEILREHWPLPDEEITNLAYQTESQLKMVSSRFGKILGADFVGTKMAGSSFIEHTYIAKFEKHAVRYICVFYKPKDNWLVNSIYWDDKTQLLFK